MAATWVDVRTPALPAALGLIQGYGDVVVEVADAARATRFYADLLGFTPAGATPDGPRLRIAPDQHLVLAERATPLTRPNSACHTAYGFPPDTLAEIEARLTAAGVPLHAYHEDRPAEQAAPRYCSDPDGNRVQLVAAAAPGIDHVTVDVHDLEWAEVFYTQVLGGQVETRIGWHMDEFVRARAWGKGEDDCAPGTRRWDKLYAAAVGDDGEDRVARPNAQIFVAFAPGVVLGVYLAAEHRQEPPRAQFVGTPRVGLRLQPGGLDALEQRLREIRLRCLQPPWRTEGPYLRQGATLYVKDPGGNFLACAE